MDISARYKHYNDTVTRDAPAAATLVLAEVASQIWREVFKHLTQEMRSIPVGLADLVKNSKDLHPAYDIYDEEPGA